MLAMEYNNLFLLASTITLQMHQINSINSINEYFQQLLKTNLKELKCDKKTLLKLIVIHFLRTLNIN